MTPLKMMTKFERELPSATDQQLIDVLKHEDINVFQHMQVLRELESRNYIYIGFNTVQKEET